MIGYTTVGTNDLAKAAAFYDRVLKILGARRVFAFERGVYYGKNSMQLGVLKPFDGNPATVGNGNMVALQAPSRAEVDAVHAAALEHGGSCEGAPGLRGDEAMGFYGAYFRDLDGNKICVFRIGPE